MLSLLLKVNSLQLWRRFKAIRQQSRLLTGTIFLFVAGYLSLSFWLFYEGLGFIASFPGLGSVLTERLLYLLFAFLFVLLLLSNLFISYTNLFRNREAGFLMSLPVPAQTIFRWKFFESTLLASWAFAFLIAPLLAAFGLTRGVPWHFYFVTVLLVALFIVLPAVIGSFLAINLARYLDRRLFQVLTVISLTTLIAGAAIWFRPEEISPESTETRVLAVLDKMLSRTPFAEFAFMPSYLLSRSVIQWDEGAILSPRVFVLGLVSHIAFFGTLAFTQIGNLF